MGTIIIRASEFGERIFGPVLQHGVVVGTLSKGDL